MHIAATHTYHELMCIFFISYRFIPNKSLQNNEIKRSFEFVFPLQAGIMSEEKCFILLNQNLSTKRQKILLNLSIQFDINYLHI